MASPNAPTIEQTVHNVVGSIDPTTLRVTVASETGESTKSVTLETYIRQLIYDDLLALGERLANTP